MGAACATVASAEDGLQRRSSLTSMKRQRTGSSIRNNDDFGSEYARGEVCDRDDHVFTVRNTLNGVEYMARAVPRSEMPLKGFTEVEDHLAALTGVDSTHICRFVEAFDVDDCFYLIYEKGKQRLFEHDKDLKANKRLPEEQVQVYCRQLAMALKSCHTQGLVHGRLNESAVLMDEGHSGDRSVKLCDVGQTFVFRPQRQTQKIDYEAPERFWDELPPVDSVRALRDSITVYSALDMWSLGILMYRMLTGKLPFSKMDKERIKSDTVEFGKEWDSMPNARSAISSLLRRNNRIRLTADQLLKTSWLALSREKVSRSKMMRVLQNVLNNSMESTFKKFALRVIAEDLEPDKLEVVEKAFRHIDRNSDGNLEIKEVREALRRFAEDEGDAVSIFEAIDRNASGSLNFAEFTAVSIGRQDYSDKEVLWQAFQRMDKAGTGMVSQDELARLVREVEPLSSADEINLEVDAISQDVELPLDFDVFVNIMLAPMGQPPNQLRIGFDRCCYTILKVDTHGVRHIPPKERVLVNLLDKPVYNTSIVMRGRPPSK